MKRIAINGFGRIGRLTFRNLINDPNVEIVAINDLTDNKILAHLLKYDTAHRGFDGTVDFDDEYLYVNGKKIIASAIRNPEELPWKELKVDVVLECTGIFRTKDQMSMHLTAGAKKVLLSAPAKDAVKTIVLGVNDQELTDEDVLISNASCTTNCLAPVVKIINEKFGFVRASMTTTHSYTSDQKIQDAPHSDLRRARAAADNIIPTSTGAAKAVGKVIPAVEGKMFAMAMRVPVITGSLIELNVVVEKSTTIEEINAAFETASQNELKGILHFCKDPIVSSDIIGNKYSSVFDSLLTNVIDGKFIKVVSWYDNEAGYSARLADLATRV